MPPDVMNSRINLSLSFNELVKFVALAHTLKPEQKRERIGKEAIPVG